MESMLKKKQLLETIWVFFVQSVSIYRFKPRLFLCVFTFTVSLLLQAVSVYFALTSNR